MAITSSVRIDDFTPNSFPVMYDVSMVDSGLVHSATVVTSSLDALVILLLIFL